MLIQHLQKVFLEKTRKNPRYSLRAFAKNLNIDSSTLSALMNGKRPLTPQMAKKILKQADLGDARLKEKLWFQFLEGSNSEATEDYSILNEMETELVASWEHFAILALLEIPNFHAPTKQISLRLNIPIAIVVDCLSRMEKLGFVQKKKDSWHLLKRNITTTTDIPNSALRMANRQYLEKALESLELDGIGDRDITGITCAIDRKKLPEAKKMIREFRRKISTYLESGSKTSVYRLNIQLFPLSKENKT